MDQFAQGNQNKKNYIVEEISNSQPQKIPSMPPVFVPEQEPNLPPTIFGMDNNNPPPPPEAPIKKVKKGKKRNVILAAITLMIMTAGVVAGITLTRQTQDPRTLASSWCTGWCPTNDHGECGPAEPFGYTFTCVYNEGCGSQGKCCTPGDTSCSPPAPPPTGGPTCGGSGQACCDPFTSGGVICNSNLYCINGTCQTSNTGLCEQNSGVPSGECSVYACGSQCNNGNQCNLFLWKGPCSQAPSMLGSQCGQIDYLNTTGGYCGVMSQNCGGSCAGGGTTNPPTATPPGQTPGPTRKQICGESCNTDSDCQNPSTAGIPVACINNVCTNVVCNNLGGVTVPGTICYCQYENSCGDECGADVGLCAPGYTCTYRADTSSTQCQVGVRGVCVPPGENPDTTGAISSVPKYQGAYFERRHCSPNGDVGNNFIYHPSFPNHVFTDQEILDYICYPKITPNLIGMCLNIKIYDTNWRELDRVDLTRLSPGDVIRFGVTGGASGGTFDRARFIINGVTGAEVTSKNPFPLQPTYPPTTSAPLDASGSYDYNLEYEYCGNGIPCAPGLVCSHYEPSTQCLNTEQKPYFCFSGSCADVPGWDCNFINQNTDNIKDPVCVRIPSEFYEDYTIPAGVTNFDIQAEIHHTDLNTWF